MEKSRVDNTAEIASTAPPASARASSLAMDANTSAWNSAWFSHKCLITEALVIRWPVLTSTRSNTRLNVRLLEAVSKPS